MQVTPLSPLMSVNQLQGKDTDPTQEGEMLKSVKSNRSVIGPAAVELIHHSDSHQENLGGNIDEYA